MKKWAALAAGMALLASTSLAQAASIDFDTGTNGASVGGFYSGLTFGNAEFTSNLGLFGSSGSLGIRSTATGYQWGSSNAITISFAGGTTDFSIGVVDLGDNGFTVEAYDIFNNLIDSETKFGPGLGVGNYDTVSVAAAGIASIRMFQAQVTSGDGILLDNMTYNVSAVPEPETYALFLLGLAGLGLAGRKRQGKTA